MAAEIISKRCSKCKRVKPLSDFYKNRGSKGGYRNDCKVCHLKDMKKYSETEKGKSTHRKARFRYSITENGKAATKRYTKSEKFKVKQRRYEQSEKGIAVKNRYLQSEKGKKTIKGRQRKESPKQIKARYAVSEAIRTGKLPRPDSLQCHYCPEQAKQYHHHNGYAPEHYLDVVPACYKCHRHQTSPSN